MANYVKITDFASKDALATGNPLKLIKGTEINDELNAIQTAVATKADLASPAFTGNPTATTQATGNSTTRLATTAFVQQEINANEANVGITGGTISGVAITGGTITGLATDLAVADGGTGKSTLALNNVLLGNGTGAVQEVAPGTSGNVLTSNGTTWTSVAAPPSIGVGQTWQNLTGSRSSGVTYTNNSGKPIMVAVHTNGVSGAVPLMSAVVSGITIANYVFIAPLAQYPSLFVSFIVPNGDTYSVSITNTTFATWAELR